MKVPIPVEGDFATCMNCGQTIVCVTRGSRVDYDFSVPTVSWDHVHPTKIRQSVFCNAELRDSDKSIWTRIAKPLEFHKHFMRLEFVSKMMGMKVHHWKCQEVSCHLTLNLIPEKWLGKTDVIPDQSRTPWLLKQMSERMSESYPTPKTIEEIWAENQWAYEEEWLSWEERQAELPKQTLSAQNPLLHKYAPVKLSPEELDGPGSFNVLPPTDNAGLDIFEKRGDWVKKMIERREELHGNRTEAASGEGRGLSKFWQNLAWWRRKR